MLTLLNILVRFQIEYISAAVYIHLICMYTNIYIYVKVQVTNLRGPSDYIILKLQSSTSYTVQVTNVTASICIATPPINFTSFINLK